MTDDVLETNESADEKGDQHFSADEQKAKFNHAIPTNELSRSNLLRRKVDKLLGRENYHWVENVGSRSNSLYQLSTEIASGILSGSFAFEDLDARLQKDRAFLSLYPSLSIPENLLTERPHLLFPRLSIDIYRPREGSDFASAPYGNLYRELNNLGLDKKTILSSAQLRDALMQIKELQGHDGISTEHLRHVMYKLIHKVYIGSLELLRLTHDQQGTVMRYTKSGEEKIDDREKHAPWSHSLDDSLKELSVNKHIAFWFRTDERGKGSYLGKKHVVTTSVRELEKQNFLTLDHGEDNAITSISID